MGDSYVAGFGDSAGLGWVGRVVVAGLSAGLPLTAYNLGVRRDTSELVSRRVGCETRARLGPAEDPRVVLSFGVNDTDVNGGVVRLSTSDSVEALRRCLRRTSPARTMMVGPPAVDDDAHNGRIATLSQAFADEAAALGVPYLDVFDETVDDDVWRAQVRAGDGFHPDSVVYECLAGVIAPAVTRWLSV